MSWQVRGGIHVWTGGPFPEPSKDELGRVRVLRSTSLLPDVVAVERAVAGDPPAYLCPADRREIVRRMHALAMSDGEIARTSGMSKATARRIRHELGLAPVEPERGISERSVRRRATSQTPAPAEDSALTLPSPARAAALSAGTGLLTTRRTA